MIDGLQIQIPTLEENTFSAMQATETAEHGLAEAQQILAKAEEVHKDQQIKLTKTKGELALMLNQCMENRKAQRAQLPDAIVATYDQIFNAKKGLAVVTSDNGICGGCRTSMPSQKALQVERGQLVTCTSCGRFLVRR